MFVKSLLEYIGTPQGVHYRVWSSKQPVKIKFNLSQVSFEQVTL